MKILFLSQLMPFPPDAGPKVRSYYVLQHLARTHEVTLLAFQRAEDPPEGLDQLMTICADVYTVPLQRSRLRDVRLMLESLVFNKPFIIHRDHVDEMTRQVDQLLAQESFDVIHVDQLWMAQYALEARKKYPQLRLVLDEHNACFQIFQRLAAGERNPIQRIALEREWRILKAYEGAALAGFDRVVTVTDEDRTTLTGLIGKEGAPDQRFSTIPICINTRSTRPVTPRPGAKDVLHLGTMFWLPNVEGVLWFGSEVWPIIAAKIPDAVFTIIGKNPPKSVRSLATFRSEPLFTNQMAHPRVEVTGYVANPRPHLEQAGVFIVPLFSGGGMRVKILDAWGWGLPIVSTTIGAEGMKYQEGENILIADSAEDFAQAVIRVLQDPELAQRLRANGRKWVEEQYDWHTTYSAWDQVYDL